MKYSTSLFKISKFKEQWLNLVCLQLLMAEKTTKVVWGIFRDVFPLVLILKTSEPQYPYFKHTMDYLF